MLQKKVCMLGAFAVGKTSLVSRFVHSLFSDRYLTTVGVKVDKKQIVADGRNLTLLLWDIPGEDNLQEVRRSYLTGMHGYLLVSDITRPATIETGLELHRRAQGVVGEVPCVFLLNKCDLRPAEKSAAVLDHLVLPMRSFATSAREGTQVEAAFEYLARQR